MIKTYKKYPYLSNEAVKQHERLVQLYGPGDYSATIKKNMKKTMAFIIAFVTLCILILLFEVTKDGLANEAVTLSTNGDITSIERPNSRDGPIVLEAEIITDTGKNITDQGIKLVILPLQTKEQKKLGEKNTTGKDIEDATQNEIRKTIYQLNSDTTVQSISLPSILTDGTKIHWVPKKTHNGWMILLITLIGAFTTYHNRNAGLTKTENAAKESVLRELPEFVNKLVLLLNAGLILSNAFNKIVSDFERFRGGENNYFYGQLIHIMMKCKETNGSVQVEIRSFAVRTGVVEFMRLSNIISDSMIKGSDLMTQLKLEGDSLWAARRKQMEEKGKIAETKLTFPLVILLLVLLMITIAPAMMEM